MAEIDSTLPWNLLTKIRDEQAGTRSDIHAMTNDMRSIKGHMARFMTNEVMQDTRIAGSMKRLGRIEHRFELRDAT